MLRRLSLTAALLAASPALAGSLSEPISNPVVAAPVVTYPAAPAVRAAAGGDWTGFYVGGQLGWGGVDLESFEFDDDVFDNDFDGTFLGVHAGYQHDFGRFVLGAELDYDMSEIELDPLDNDGGVEVDDIARFKLRAGYDAGRILPYVTAGWATANLSSSIDSVDDAINDSADGSVWGLGVAYAVSDRIFVSGEYLTHSFEDSPFEERDFDVGSFSLRGSYRF